MLLLLNTYPLRVSQDLVFRSKEATLESSVSVMVYSLSGLDHLTEENVALLAKQALAARRAVPASTLAAEYPDDFARIIGLHTYSQSPRRDYDIELTGNWVERGGFRFEEFILTPRKEEPHGRNE